MKTIEELALEIAGPLMDCSGMVEPTVFASRLLAAWQAEHAEPVYIVFDGPPSHISPKFVDVENAAGMSVCAGEWAQIGRYWNFGPLYCAPQPAIPEGMCLVPIGLLKDLDGECLKNGKVIYLANYIAAAQRDK